VAKKRLSRQESRIQTQERLLEAAAKVFSQRGFYEASIEEIAEEAGFSKGAVYSNFASKEELFMVLLDRHLTAELQGVKSQFTKNRHDTTQDQSFADGLEKNHTWNMLTIEFFLYAMRHPPVQQQAAERYRHARQELTTLLQEQHYEESEGKLPAEYIAWAVLALGTGLMLQSYLEPGAMPPDLYTTIVARLLS
jgi:AcrR family transcriptional regulator